MSASVRLRPMTGDEFDAWQRHSIPAYAAENAEASGMPLDEALERAHEEYRELLPDGARTAGMAFFRVLDADGVPAGILWLGPHPNRADTGFVFDIEVDEDRRGEGIGRATMLAAEDVCRERGWTTIALSVHGPNVRARALYDSLGFETVSTRMRKALDG